jgi:hypothetical protein
MRGWIHLSYELCGVIAGGIVVLVALGLRAARFVRRWRAKNPDELERLRRLRVNQHGRIASAEIVNVIDEGPPESPTRVLVYRYEVAGIEC